MERREAIRDERIGRLESGQDETPILGIRKSHINKMIGAYGKKREVYDGKLAYRKANKEFNHHFGIGSYDQLPNWRYGEAVKWLQERAGERRL